MFYNNISTLVIANWKKLEHMQSNLDFPHLNLSKTSMFAKIKYFDEIWNLKF